jgi:3-dehydroquinate synthase
VSSLPKTINVHSGLGDYSATFFPSIRESVEAFGGQSSLYVLIDRNVWQQFGPSIQPAVENRPLMLINATEEAKTLEGVSAVATWLQQNKATKQSHLLAIGGGIVQDIAAFTSHCYYRGIRWSYLPTTLLAMSDSCIGAKCGINHNGFKNHLGVFQAPQRVHIATEFLEGVDDVHVKSGYGEILKLLITGSQEDFAFLEAALAPPGSSLRSSHLPEFIRRSLANKRTIIEQDEFETDLRRILNYGHTFGHALENLSGYEVPHGLAVAWGIDVVNHIAVRKGLLSPGYAARIRAFIKTHLAFEMQYVPKADVLVEATKSDKKVDAAGVNLVLLHESPFGLRVVSQPYDANLRLWVQEYFDQPHAFARN